MESSNNLPMIMITKKVWNMIRFAFFMLRKGISKGKLTMDLNILLKCRRKLAGKSIASLMTGNDITRLHQFSTTREYEFSCSNTPNNFFSIKRNRRNNLFTRSHAPTITDDDEGVTVSAVRAVLEMLSNEVTIDQASPALTVFGRSPMARQLIRVTDSPFPAVAEEDKDSQVDKHADEFIKRFYKELRKQG